MQTLPTWIAGDSAEAVHIAEQIGYPVALKLRSPDIPHKSDVQGVMLYLRTATEVQQAADAIIDRVKMTWPGPDPRPAGAEHVRPCRCAGATRGCRTRSGFWSAHYAG